MMTESAVVLLKGRGAAGGGGQAGLQTVGSFLVSLFAFKKLHFTYTEAIFDVFLVFRHSKALKGNVHKTLVKTMKNEVRQV